MYTNNIEGWMTQEELSWLYSTAGGMRDIVEVGCWLGRSTHALLSGCPQGRIFAIDHWRGSRAERTTTHRAALERDLHAEFCANVGYFPNLTVIKLPSIEAAACFPPWRRFDMVFLDAGHTYTEVSQDLATWFPRTRRLIAVHDYCDELPEVRAAVNDFFEAGVMAKAGSIAYWWREHT